MRIILNELKKIWNIKIIAVAAVLCLLYFAVFMSGYIGMYQHSVNTWFGNINLAHYLTEKYGATLEPDEFEDFLNYREVIIAELNSFMESRPVFAEAGIFTYDEYLDFAYGGDWETLSDEELNLRHTLILEWGGSLRTIDGDELRSEHETPLASMKIFSYGNVVSFYKSNVLMESEWGSHIDSFMAHNPLSEREVRRLEEIRDSGELRSILDHQTIRETGDYARSLGVLVVLATLILVSPLIAGDRANRVNWLQYSSRQGRSILIKRNCSVG